MFAVQMKLADKFSLLATTLNVSQKSATHGQNGRCRTRRGRIVVADLGYRCIVIWKTAANYGCFAQKLLGASY